MEDRALLEKAIAQAGGAFQSAAIPDVITPEWLTQQCEQLERALRAQFRKRQLPDDDEADLETLKAQGGGLRLWSRLKHLWWRQEESLVRADVSGDREHAAVQLMTREPVRTWIAGRWVDVTYRGQLALVRLARHDLARRNLDRELRRVAELVADVLERREAGTISKNGARRRIGRLGRIHGALYDELVRHTRVILANALTADASAVDEKDAAAWLEVHAPWWAEITPDDEQELFRALVEAGPGRLLRMGAAPADDAGADDARDGRVWREDFGFWSLYAFHCREHGLTPAEMANEDVAQFSAMYRIGQPYFPPLKRPGGA